MTIKLMSATPPNPSLLAWTSPAEELDAWAERGFVCNAEELNTPTEGCALHISAGAPALGVKAGIEIVVSEATPTFLGLDLVLRHSSAMLWLANAVTFGCLYLVTTPGALDPGPSGLLHVGERQALLAVAEVRADDQMLALVRDFAAE
jgi:hypothetical protein